MLKYFSADWIFPVSDPPVQNGVIVTDSEGKIINLFTEEKAKSLNIEVERHPGAIVPGLINTHCHLELSHMHHVIPEHTGLVSFVQKVISERQSAPETVLEAMKNADEQMYRNGIVAVGDIANQILSKEVKTDSNIYYHTFIEAMGFNPARARVIMDDALSLYEQFSPLPASIVPHAPYSVSLELFQLIQQHAEKADHFISIHNQETVAEDTFFKNKTGDFLKLYEFLGLDLSFYQASGRSSLQTYSPYLKKIKTLLVHNTFSTQDDIEFALRQVTDLFWCLCPQANAYIENQLPDVDLLMANGVTITLGTDSLASNHQLNILSEMKILQERKNISFDQLLRWATLNGARYLGIADQYGSFEVGKSPGLNLIPLTNDFILTGDQVKRLI